MKTALALLFATSLIVSAADQRPQPVKQQEKDDAAQQVKKLGSVTWDLERHKLVWTVQKGSMVNDEFVPASEERYEISPDEATMLVAEEERVFDNQEAVSLHRLLDVLSVYCAESVVWWDQGKGAPVEPNRNTTKPARPPAKKVEPGKAEPKPVKVHEQEPKPTAPKYRVPDNQLVAMGRGAK